MKRIKYRYIIVESDEGEIDEINLRVKDIPYSSGNLETAKSESYNGKYEIIDDGEPEPLPTEQEQLRADVDFLLMLAEEG